VFSRWLLISCLAAATVWNPVAPPEHVHEAEEHGAMHFLAHRHVEAHFGDSHHAEDHGGAAVDHDAGRVLTVDSVVSLPTAPVVFGPALASTIAVLPPPAVAVLHGFRDDIERLIHGPPRTAVGLRAPPASSRL
jgi:hypothetical protein